MLLRRERRLLAPPEAHSWWRSHAQCPTVLELDEVVVAHLFRRAQRQ